MGLSRNEDILENLLGAQNELGDPQSRIEALLMQIVDQNTKMLNLPTVAGDYSLKVTVVDNEPSYEWTSIEVR